MGLWKSNKLARMGLGGPPTWVMRGMSISREITHLTAGENASTETCYSVNLSQVSSSQTATTYPTKPPQPSQPPQPKPKLPVILSSPTLHNNCQTDGSSTGAIRSPSEIRQGRHSGTYTVQSRYPDRTAKLWILKPVSGLPSLSQFMNRCTKPDQKGKDPTFTSCPMNRWAKSIGVHVSQSWKSTFKFVEQ